MEIPVTIVIDDKVFAALLARLLPESSALAAVSAAASGGDGFELPGRWSEVEDRGGTESYRWPNREEPERYAAFRVYDGDLSGKSVHIALGDCDRDDVWGRLRPYKIAFHVTERGGKYPLAEFLEDDEGGYVSLVKGKGANRRSMYGPDEALPAGYAALPTALYADRIHAKGAWRRQAVVASPSDTDTMLNHALIQGALRYNVRPR